MIWNNSKTVSAASKRRETFDRSDLPKTWTNPRDGSVMRLIPAGEFIMGSTLEQIEIARRMDIGGHEFSLLNETPQFRASIPSFYMSVHAVTNKQFANFLNETQPSTEELKRLAPDLAQINMRLGFDFHARTGGLAYSVTPGFEEHPAIHLSWFGAQAYSRWAGLRLPMDIEWEKAARGVDGRIYPWGNEWRDDFLRWHNTARCGETTAPVHAYPEGCSPYGILQMAGNVDEWCADWYQWDAYRRYATGNLRHCADKPCV